MRSTELAAICWHLLVPALCSYLGPSPKNLIGYWPFNEKSGPNYVYGNSHMLGDPHDTGAGQLVQADPRGPFDALAACYTTSNASIYFIRYPDATIPKAFTISFYFYTGLKRDNSNFKRIVKFGEGKGRQLAIGYRGKYLFLDLPYVRPQDAAGTPYWSAFSTQTWAFIGISYNDSNNHLLQVFDASGLQLFQANLKQPLPSMTGLAIGAIEKKDRIACLAFYNTVLTSAQFARLPCVCKTKGRCPDNLSINKFNYRGPQPENLVGFWPLTTKYGGAEATNGSTAVGPPQAFRVKTGSALGPFGKPLYLYSPYEDGEWIVEDIPLQPVDSFTVSFYFHVRTFESKFDTGIPLLKFGKLTFSYHDVDNSFILIKNSFQVVLNVKTVLSEGNWKFLAITFKGDEKLTELYEETGQKFASYPKLDLTSSRPSWDLSIGPIRRHMALTCLTIFKTALTGKEIAKLRCNCVNAVLSAKCVESRRSPQGFTGLPDVIAFWPFDIASGLSDIANGLEDTGKEVNGRLVVNMFGPFHRLKSSYSVLETSLKGDNIANYLIDTKLNKSFTFSVYFWPSGNSDGTIFEMKGIFSLNYRKSSLFVTFGFSYQVEVAITAKSWNLLILTYISNSKSVSIHRQSGEILQEIKKVPLETSEDSKLQLNFGPVFPEDRLSCAILWNRALTAWEISRIQCACNRRGNCPRFRNIDRNSRLMNVSDKSIHCRKQLVGFWPFDSKYGSGEAVIGILPRSISSSRVYGDSRPSGYFEKGGMFLRTTRSVDNYQIDKIRHPTVWTISFFLRRIKRFARVLDIDSNIRISYTSQNLTLTFVGKEFQFSLPESQPWTFVGLAFSPKSLSYCQLESELSSNQSESSEELKCSDIAIVSNLKVENTYSSILKLYSTPHAPIRCLSIWNGVMLPREALTQLPEFCFNGFIQNLAPVSIKLNAPDIVILTSDNLEMSNCSNLNVSFLILLLSTIALNLPFYL